MNFYCERIKADVDRNTCEEYCVEFENCRDSGYLAERDKKCGFKSETLSEQKRLQTLRKTVREALKPKLLWHSLLICLSRSLKPLDFCLFLMIWKGDSHTRLKIDLYQKKISGMTDLFSPPFKMADFQEIVNSLKISINPEKLYKESVYYLASKTIWDENPSPREISTAAYKIHRLSKKLVEELENLNSSSPNIYNALLSQSYDLNNLRFELHRVSNHIDEKFGGDKLGNLPRDHYIVRLAEIYKVDIKKKPTVSYDRVSNKCSKFLQLVSACFEIVG